MRADQYLVHHGHYDSRARAQSAIKAGKVTIDGVPARKASQTIASGAKVVAEAEHPWVSRGGLKLFHALEVFGVKPDGLQCLDVGSSTGGFTQVLLERGAAKVCAVDVGQGQLHSFLHNHPRLISLENQDARDLTENLIGFAPDLVVCDASFIGLSKVLEIPLSLAAPRAKLVSLVKPQFEVGRDGIGRGGLVKSEELALQSLENVKTWLAGLGWEVKADDVSPIKGGSGNTEYLIWAERG